MTKPKRCQRPSPAHAQAVERANKMRAEEMTLRGLARQPYNEGIITKSEVLVQVGQRLTPLGLP